MKGEDYLDSKPSLDRLNHLDLLKSVLKEAGVNKEDIMLYGSSITAIYGIKPNNDLEFIPHPDVRSNFLELAEENPDINKARNGQIHFPGEVKAVWEPGKFEPFGWSDEELFEDETCYIETKGYKFLKLELFVSLKAAKRRPKDFEHIDLLEEEDYIGGEDWNWELVHQLPPWERRERPPKSLIEIGRDSIKQYGLFYTAARGPTYVASHLGSKALQKIGANNEAVKDKLQTTGENLKPFIERNNQYQVPALLNDQFDDEEFERYDLVAAILYLEGKEEFKDFFEGEDYEEQISVTPKGRLNGGLLELANKLAEISEDETDLATIDISVKISRKPSISKRGRSWAENKFGPDRVELLENRKEELLENSGVYFYAMLWPSVRDYHDEIEAWIQDRIEVKESINLDLKENIHDYLESVYSVDARPSDWEKERKIKKIQSFGSEVSVLKLRVDNPDFWYEEDEPISNTVHSLKQKCRKEFQKRVENYEYGVITHFTDNYEHNAHNSKILDRYKS
ncbi:hypothetical protein AQV86_00770 [Nanohaloarchaea archaeon SG9]|nr:hypothetical protein AQV86_00770 [Nanohaloarchaea archaeon SG9]